MATTEAAIPLVSVTSTSAAVREDDDDELGGSISSMSPGLLAKFNNEKRKTEKWRMLKKFGGVNGLARMLGSDLGTGLSTASVDDHWYSYGRNVYAEPPAKTFLSLYIEALSDTMLLILLACGAVSFILGLTPLAESGVEWIEGLAIFLAVAIVSIVTSLNNYFLELQFRELNKQNENEMVKVRRDGEQQEVSIYDLTPGDVVILETGAGVPADGLYVGGNDLHCDQSTMTGESLPVKKHRKRPWMLSGCTVSSGEGRMLVTAVGGDSEWGQMLSKLQVPWQDTPLQMALGDLAEQIGLLGLFVAALVFAVLTIYWVMDVSETHWRWGSLSGMLANLIIGITIIVVAVPEGLPLAVTIALAYSKRRMMDDQNLVRNLASCEIMGGATNICSDKTGTLTTNRMTVLEGWVAGEDMLQVPPTQSYHATVHKLLTEGICANSAEGTALRWPVDATGAVPEDAEPLFSGNGTECALLLFAHILGVDYDAIRRETTDLIERHGKRYPFSSARKRSTVVIPKKNRQQQHSGYRVYCKGASEIVTQWCSQALNPEGVAEPLDEARREQVMARIHELASKGLRTIALAYTEIDHFDGASLHNQEDASQPLRPVPVESDLTLVAIMGIKDPVRPDVPEAIARCRNAGIRVRMVTGDLPETARKIAEDCGLLSDDGVVIEGPQFAALSDDEVDALLPRLDVLARSSPMDKLRLVQRLKAHDEVVAVTGDGTNDAPALKAAHVGLAMGIVGTKVAKKAADIIILDDNFATIVKTVMWGRSIFDNIRKFLQFQLTINVAALVVAFVGAVTRHGEPLKPIQLLWVNLIMDTMAALALATEKPSMELLDRPPINTLRQRLISNVMLRNVALHAIYQIAVLLTTVYFAYEWFGLTAESDRHYTLVFNTFVWMQLFNEINARRVSRERDWTRELFNVWDRFFENPFFAAILAITAAVQIFIVFFGRAVFATEPLSLYEWAYCLGLAVAVLPYGILVRLIPVPDDPKPSGSGAAAEHGDGDGDADADADDDDEEGTLGYKQEMSFEDQKKLIDGSGDDESNFVESLLQRVGLMQAHQPPPLTPLQRVAEEDLDVADVSDDYQSGSDVDETDDSDSSDDGRRRRR